MDFSRRTYRQAIELSDLVPFECKVKETDLLLTVDRESYCDQLISFVESRILYYRALLDAYIGKDPDFLNTLEPHILQPSAPPIALSMARAGNTAGVGPMAAVAGAFAEAVGLDLLSKVKQVTVENGGDVFLKTDQPARIVVLAGSSPLSGKLALQMPASDAPYGVCTSSGTVGPSLSFGRADAAVIVSPSAPLADAVATATANLVQTTDDLAEALKFARSISGITAALIIKEDKLTVWGDLRIVPYKS
jgi:uncharacterized protein